MKEDENFYEVNGIIAYTLLSEEEANEIESEEEYNEDILVLDQFKYAVYDGR